MAEEDYGFYPWLIADPPIWRMVDQVPSGEPAENKRAAAKIQINLYRETLAAQLKAVEAVAKIIEQDFDKPD